MKTRNNQSNADETPLNQSITRRSFVKRGAVASAATVFGSVALTTSANANDNEGPWRKTYSLSTTITYEGPYQTVQEIASKITGAGATLTNTESKFYPIPTPAKVESTPLYSQDEVKKADGTAYNPPKYTITIRPGSYKIRVAN